MDVRVILHAQNGLQSDVNFQSGVPWQFTQLHRTPRLTTKHNKALSTRIRIFLNPQISLCGFKNLNVRKYPYQKSKFPVHKYPTSIRPGIRRSDTIRSSTQDSSGNMASMVVKRAKSALCYDSRFYGRIESAQKSKKNERKKVESLGPLLPLPRRLRERTWKRSCHHHVKSPGKKYLWRADSKRFGFVGRIHRIRVDGSRMRKEKGADSKVPGYVWTRLAERRRYWAAIKLRLLYTEILY